MPDFDVGDRVRFTEDVVDDHDNLALEGMCGTVTYTCGHECCVEVTVNAFPYIVNGYVLELYKPCMFREGA